MLQITVTAPKSKYEFYVRCGSSTIVAKGEVLDQLRDLANRTPFDERGNSEIKYSDISATLLRDYLVYVKSKLADSDLSTGLPQVLEQMNLLEGPTERRAIKNVAAMMFCDYPEKFFPVTYARIAIFPEGRDKNPNNLKEIPIMTGSIPHIISNVLNFLKTNIIEEHIIKPKDDERSIRFFNYPYQALEEAVVNAFYHRDYQEREPVEITIEPNRISILSFSGPDRSITMESIKSGDSLRSRRYRNRTLGEFLKELDLSEGWATGIPTIQTELKNNGSPKAVIETDEDRTYFLIDIPCHLQAISYSIGPDDELSTNLLSKVLSKVKELIDNNIGFSRSDFVKGSVQGSVQGSKDVAVFQMACVLLVLDSPLSTKEIMQRVNAKNVSRFRNTVLYPLIECGMIEMQYPNNQFHPRQRYLITNNGHKLLETNN